MHTHLEVAGHFDTRTNKGCAWQLTSALVTAIAVVGAAKLTSCPSTRHKFYRMIPAVLVIFEAYEKEYQKPFPLIPTESRGSSEHSAGRLVVL